MLASIMVLLNMVGGGTPPPPTPTDHGGGRGDQFKHESEAELRKKRILRDDEEIIWFAGSWLVSKKRY